MTGSSCGCKFQPLSSSCCSLQLCALPVVHPLLYLCIPVLFMSASKISTTMDSVFHEGFVIMFEKLKMTKVLLQSGGNYEHGPGDFRTVSLQLQAFKEVLRVPYRWRNLSLRHLPCRDPSFQQEWGCLWWHVDVDACAYGQQNYKDNNKPSTANQKAETTVYPANVKCCMVCFVLPCFSVGDVVAKGLAVVCGVPSLLLRSLPYKCVLQN